MEETIGQILLAAREKKKLSLEQVAEITSFRAESLHALEEDDYSYFKSEIYVKGTIRGYANFLGLNGLELVERYKSERKEQFGNSNVHGNNSSVNMSLRHEQGVGTQTNFFKESKAIPVKGILKGLCIILIMIGMYFSLPGIFGVDDNNKPKTTTVTETVTENTNPKNAGIGTKIVNAYETIVNLLNDDSDLNKEIDAYDKTKNTNQTITKSQNSVNTKKSVPQVVVPKNNEKRKDANAIGERYDKVVVEMTANGQCWIDVFADGKAIYSGLMTEGRYKIFEGKKRVTVKYGNIGVMQVIVNGKPVDMRGATGVVTRNYPK